MDWWGDWSHERVEHGTGSVSDVQITPELVEAELARQAAAAPLGFAVEGPS